MALTIYGGEYVGSLNGTNRSAVRHYIPKTNTILNKGDFVKLAAGYLEVASAGDKVLGVLQASCTAAQATTGAKLPVLIDPMALYRVRTDATIVQADCGTGVDVTGTTGAMGITMTGKAAGKGTFLVHEIEDAGTAIVSIFEGQLVAAAVVA